jgi:branched-chain amino acid transport system substrate-binding protein
VQKIRLAGAALAVLAFIHPAGAQDTYRIAGVISLTGPLGFSGISFKKASDLAIEMHNGGKVAGRKIQISWEDDESKPQVTAQKGAKLAASNPDMMLGSATTPSTLALMKITEQRKIPHIITLGGGDPITGAGKTAYAWRTTIRLDMENRTGAAYVRQMKFKKIYGVSFDYQVTRQRWDAFKQLVLSTSETKIAGESFSAVDNMDFSLIIENAVRSGADGFWIDLPGTVGTAFLKQAAQVNLKGKMQLFGPVVVDDESAAAIGDGALGVSTGTRWHWSLENPESKKFVEAFKKKYNELPDQYGGEAYDGLAWWLAHIEKMGTFDKEKLLQGFATSTWEKSIKGKKTMRACDHQAMQVGYWGEIVPGVAGGPKYVLKITATFPSEDIFPPCQ